MDEWIFHEFEGVEDIGWPNKKNKYSKETPSPLL